MPSILSDVEHKPNFDSDESHAYRSIYLYIHRRFTLHNGPVDIKSLDSMVPLEQTAEAS